MNGYEYKINVDANKVYIEYVNGSTISARNGMCITDSYIMMIVYNGGYSVQLRDKVYPYTMIKEIDLGFGSLQRPPYFGVFACDDCFMVSHNQTGDWFLFSIANKTKVVTYSNAVFDNGDKIIALSGSNYNVHNRITGVIESTKTFSLGNNYTMIGASQRYVYYVGNSGSSGDPYRFGKMEISTATKTDLSPTFIPKYSSSTGNGITPYLIYTSTNDCLVRLVNSYNTYCVCRFNPTTETYTKLYDSTSAFLPFSGQYGFGYCGNFKNGNIATSAGGNVYVISNSMTIISQKKFPSSWANVKKVNKKFLVPLDRFVITFSGIYDMESELFRHVYSPASEPILLTIYGDIYTEKENTIIPSGYKSSSSYEDYDYYILDCTRLNFKINFAMLV